VNNLGVHLDSQLTMADHIAVVTRSGTQGSYNCDSSGRGQTIADAGGNEDTDTRIHQQSLRLL